MLPLFSQGSLRGRLSPSLPHIHPLPCSWCSQMCTQSSVRFCALGRDVWVPPSRSISILHSPFTSLIFYWGKWGVIGKVPRTKREKRREGQLRWRPLDPSIALVVSPRESECGWGKPLQDKCSWKMMYGQSCLRTQETKRDIWLKARRQQSSELMPTSWVSVFPVPNILLTHRESNLTNHSPY